MATVSTGQLTIVDQNDAKPIMAIVTANKPPQQVYSKDNGAELFAPNWTSDPITLTASVFVGGVNVVNTSAVTGKKWGTTFGGNELGTATTYTRNTNFTSPNSQASETYYFSCTYTDPATSIASRVDCQITLSVVKIGTNAVYVQTYGQNVIEESDSGTKNAVAIRAELIRSSGPDTDNLQYRWFRILSNGTAEKLYNGVSGANDYAVSNTALGSSPVPVTLIGTAGSTSFTNAGMTTSSAGATDADWSVTTTQYNTLTISERAVTNSQLFKVEIRDAAEPDDATAPVYVGYFTVTDVTDPYRTDILSSGGDKLLNGTGSSDLTPKVWNGSAEISSYTGWTFDWFIKDKDGKRVGFVVSASPPTPSVSRTISASTNSTTGVTLNTAATFSVGDLVKLVSPNGSTIKYAEVSASSTGTTVSIRAATTAANTAIVTEAGGAITTVSTIGATEFAGGTIYKAEPKRQTTGSNSTTVTQHDIDGKNTFVVLANRPD